MSTTFNNELEKEEYKNSTSGYFLEHKELFIEWGKENNHYENPFFQDLLEEFDELSRNERFNMYLHITNREDDYNNLTRNERNIERFEEKQDREKEDKEKVVRVSKTYENNSKNEESKKYLSKIKDIILLIIAFTLFVYGYYQF